MDRQRLQRHLARLQLVSRLPTDEPFTSADALRQGLTYDDLRGLVADARLVHPLRGVYHSPELPDSLDLRIRVLGLVTPPQAVVTDRTAAWLWGAERVLAPGAHLVVPQVSMFCLPGSRLRNKLTDSGQRMLKPSDTEVVGGLRVTTPLRTACDVGRLLHRDQAIGVMDALAALDRFSVTELVDEARRFRGFRGVIQLRELAPIVDGMSGSPGESTMRLRWISAGLPPPRCQVQVSAPRGVYFIDVGLAAHQFGAEYFGEEFHGEDQAAHDESRLAWLREERGWVIVVLRKQNVYGHDQDAEGLLLQGARAAGLLPAA